jgi:hypothetical protein
MSAGMFGSGFTLRLARAEAVAVGGALEQRKELLHLDLPVWTGSAPSHTLPPDESGLSA